MTATATHEPIWTLLYRQATPDTVREGMSLVLKAQQLEGTDDVVIEFWNRDEKTGYQWGDTVRHVTIEALRTILENAEAVRNVGSTLHPPDPLDPRD